MKFIGEYLPQTVGATTIQKADPSVLYSGTRGCWTISDFGLTSSLIGYDALTDYARGTGGYRAPELLGKESRYSKKVDIWALGCVTFEIVTRKKVFGSDFQVFSLIQENSDIPIPGLNHLGKGWSFWRKTILKMLRVRETERPSASTLHTEFQTRWQREEAEE